MTMADDGIMRTGFRDGSGSRYTSGTGKQHLPSHRRTLMRMAVTVARRVALGTREPTLALPEGP